MPETLQRPNRLRSRGSCTADVAPQLFKAGVHPKVVSQRLGHASIGITLDMCSQMMPGLQEEAAAGL